MAEAKLLAKYGGLRFRDPDTKTDFMMDKEEINSRVVLQYEEVSSDDESSDEE